MHLNLLAQSISSIYIDMKSIGPCLTKQTILSPLTGHVISQATPQVVVMLFTFCQVVCWRRHNKSADQLTKIDSTFLSLSVLIQICLFFCVVEMYYNIGLTTNVLKGHNQYQLL